MTQIKQNIWRTAVLLAAVVVPVVPASAQARGGVTWRGDVDDTVIVSIHGDNVRTDTVHGKGPSNVDKEVSGYLPHEPLLVTLRHWDGRGSVRVVQQPDPDNNFTARVRIHDPQPGRGHYEFELSWRPDADVPGRVFRGAVPFRDRDR